MYFKEQRTVAASIQMVFGFGGLERWNGLDWNDGMEWTMCIIHIIQRSLQGHLRWSRMVHDLCIDIHVSGASSIKILEAQKHLFCSKSCWHYVPEPRHSDVNIIDTQYRIAGNFRGRKLSQIGRKGAFRGENFYE